MKNTKLKEKLRSFGFQMAFFNLAAGFAVIVLFSVIVYTVTSDIFVKESVSKTQMAIESGAGGIGQYINNAKKILKIYANNAAFVDFSVSDTNEGKAKALRKMKEIKDSDSNVFEVFAIFQNGKIIRSDGSAPKERFEDINSNEPCLSNLRTDNYEHKDPWTVTIATPIFNENGKNVGTLAMDLDYCLFMDTVSVFDMGENGNIAIVDNNGDIVFHTEKDILLQENARIDMSNESSNSYDPKTNLLTHSFKIPDTNWTMIGTASLDGLKVLKRQISDMVIFTGILLFFLLFAITATVSKKLTKPLSRLAQSMEDIKNLAELTIYESEITETLTLTRSYNKMIQKIKQLMRELEEKQDELRKYEFDALTSQINPHFLYNTLDTIVWLAEFRDNDKIIDLTKSLAAFFRLSLNGAQAVVSVKDEIEHVKQYLFIQKARYDDKLTYSFVVEQEALVCMVPKIILQPIVENAIYHGIKQMEGTGHIRIEAYVDKNNLILRVCDNGVGFEAEENSYKSTKESGGVGLYNVERRIKLYYGEEVFINIKSFIGGGTEVSLNLKTENRKKSYIITNFGEEMLEKECMNTKKKANKLNQGEKDDIRKYSNSSH